MRFSDAINVPSGIGGASGLIGDGEISSDSERCCITAKKIFRYTR